jgi:hypothetical protein
VECEEYRVKVFTHQRHTGSDKEPSHQADEGAPDTLSLLILLHAETKNGGKRKRMAEMGRNLLLRTKGGVMCGIGKGFSEGGVSHCVGNIQKRGYRFAVGRGKMGDVGKRVKMKNNGKEVSNLWRICFSDLRNGTSLP